MSDQDFEYPDDYQSPDAKQEKDNGNTQEKEKEQQEVKKSEKKEGKSSQRQPDQQKAAALDEKERAAMKWLNEGNALQPLLDDPPSVYRHKSVLYDLANRL